MGEAKRRNLKYGTFSRRAEKSVEKPVIKESSRCGDCKDVDDCEGTAFDDETGEEVCFRESEKLA